MCRRFNVIILITSLFVLSLALSGCSGAAGVASGNIDQGTIDRDLAEVDRYVAELEPKRPQSPDDMGKLYITMDPAQYYFMPKGDKTPQGELAKITSGYYLQHPEMQTDQPANLTPEAQAAQVRSLMEEEHATAKQIQKALEVQRQHPEFWPPQIREVAFGRVFRGMSTELALASWGEPARRKVTSKYELWWYPNSKGRDLLAFSPAGVLFYMSLDR